MAYTPPEDVDERAVAIDGAGTVGRRIASVYAAGGTDVNVFDLSAEQRDAVRDYVERHLDETRKILGPGTPAPTTSGRPSGTRSSCCPTARPTSR